MRINDNALNCFKFFAITLSILAITNLTLAQTRPPQNIRRVTVTNQYLIEKGKATDKSWSIYQEIYDSLGRLHTEIDLNFPDHYPHNYIWHTFNGRLKVKTEFYKNEKLQAIEEYFYNPDSLLIKRVVKRASLNDTSIYYTLLYKYDIRRNPIEINAKTAAGKTAYLSKSTYNDKGKELTRKVKAKKNFSPQDSILKLACIPVYDSIGRMVSESTTISKVAKPIITKNFKYSYDKKNNQIGLLEVEANGTQIRREERAYNYSRNRLSLIKYFDSSNTLVKLIEKRYEIYRTNERKVREIDY